MPGILSSPSGPHTHPEPTDLHPASDQLLSATLVSSPHTFLQPPPSLHAASLVLAKRYLDPLATSISEAQAQRQENARKKRKRGEADDHDAQKVLRLKQVHTEGFTIEQVWEQARRILDASQQEVERSLPSLQREEIQAKPDEPNNDRQHVKALNQNVRFAGEEGSALEQSSSGDEEIELDDEELDEEAAVQELEVVEEGEEDLEASAVNGEALTDDDNELEDDADVVGGKQSNTFVPDKNGLNDGFFSIDDFNRQSEFLEYQDARGEPNDGAASDEEDIDWDADPAALPLPPNGDALESEDEEDGPTFGNADLDGPDISDNGSAVSALDDDVGGNTNSIMYADFFLPPPSKASKRSVRLAKTQPPPHSSTLAREPFAEDDLQRTIPSVRRDLFSDTSPHTSSAEDGDSANPSYSQLSSHQKRTAKLAA